MITELFLSAIFAAVEFMGGLLPSIETPTWIADISDGVATVTGAMAPLGVWLPFGAAGNALVLVIAAVVVAVVVKLVRIVASFLTAGGGSAA